MPEALTESFCERCGTRYEFAAPTQLSGLRKTRGLISGLRNYIMSQDTLSDAVGDAMRSEEEVLAAAQLDAFHDSFSFCIQCRQYTCVNCWNDSAGRCRTCVPIPGTDDLIERFEASFTAQHAAAPTEGVVELDEADLNRRLGVEAWPSADLSTAGGNGSEAPEWPPEAAPVGEPGEVAATAEVGVPEAEVGEPEPILAEGEAGEVEVAAVVEPEPVGTDLVVVAEGADVSPEPEWPDRASPVTAAAAGAGAEALAWEDDAAFELEPEPEVEAEVAVEPEPEPILAEVEAEPEPEPEPEPILAEVEAEPEPEPPAPRPIVPISETILRIPPAEPTAVEPVAAELDDPALAARRAKLDLLGLGDPGEGPVSATGNVLPYRSSGASVHPAEIAARQAAGIAAVGGSFWEASAREVAGVMTNVGVQACGECGLSLSASARFCRRCGTRQARSA